MLAAQRHSLILTRLREHGAVEIAPLSRELSVTPMTIRRDLLALARQGLVVRIRGGAVLPQDSRIGHRPGGASRETGDGERCAVCGMAAGTRTRVRLQPADGAAAAAVACCPHCALLYLAGRPDAVGRGVLVTDFLTGAMVSAPAAHYVLEPDVHTCCAPAVLAFSRRQDAERFRRGFGGRVVSYRQAMRALTG